MSRTPRVRGRELIRALRKAGFVILRVRGSHHFLAHPDGRTTVVPVHAGGQIGPGLLRAILTDCELSAEDLRELL